MRFVRDSSLGVRAGTAIGVVAAIVGIAVGVKQLFSDDNGGGSPPAPPSRQNVTPASGDSVPRDISARGTLSNVPSDRHGWLAVRDHGLPVPPSSELPAAGRPWRAHLPAARA